MEKDSNSNEYFINIVSDFSKLKSSYIEAKNNFKKLENFVAILREDLKIAKDAERKADFKKSCSQTFVVQQQQVINKLLGVKEENVSLKESLKQLQITKNDLINKHKFEQEKRDNEIEQMKNTHMKEILLIKESADKEVLKVQSESEATLNSLEMQCIELTAQIDFIKSSKDEIINSTVLKYNEKISKLNEKVMALQAENKELKERSAANITIFQKKLAEQEHQHRVEIENWKHAEMNRMSHHQNVTSKQSNFNNMMNQQYTTNPMVLYQNQNMYQTNHKPPLNVTMSKKLITTYQTANDFYRQNRNETNNEDKTDTIDDIIIESSKDELNISVNKPKPKFPAPIKKRKLYSASDSTWAD